MTRLILHKIPGLESDTMRHTPLPPPKVIKSILKKNKKLPTNNDQNSITGQVVHNPPADITQVEVERHVKPNTNNKLHNGNAHSNQNISNSLVKRVHLDSKQDICIDDINEHDELVNEHLQNGVAFKPREKLQTIQVEIH